MHLLQRGARSPIYPKLSVCFVSPGPPLRQGGSGTKPCPWALHARQCCTERGRPSPSPHSLLQDTRKSRAQRRTQEQFPPCSAHCPQPSLNQVIGMCRLISSSVWLAQQTDQLWHLYSWANLARRCVSRCAGASHPSAAILFCLFG